MKTTITTLHQSHFKESGKISFDNFPFNSQEIEQAIAKSLEKEPSGRDLWRTSPPLQKFLLRKLAPLAADLLSKPVIRLVCDQWLSSSIKAPLETLFGFQPLLCIASIHEGIITFYHPSMPCPVLEHYFVVFGLETTCYIKKASDPTNHLPKQQGYAFGDRLKADLHPLLYFS